MKNQKKGPTSLISSVDWTKLPPPKSLAKLFSLSLLLTFDEEDEAKFIFVAFWKFI
jgi:hypothetical protein